MPQGIETLKQNAERLFLGQGSVVGIGIVNDEGHAELLFLLSGESKKTTESIQTWASQNRVAVRFLVTGKIKTLTKS
jgi:hypothetical protein